jgi:hypothetical protein
LVGTWGALVVEDAEASFLEANEQFSILLSQFICCCQHSRLQKAPSPIQEIITASPSVYLANCFEAFMVASINIYKLPSKKLA